MVGSESMSEDEEERWSRHWQRCETVVTSEFSRLGQALPFSWGYGGGFSSQGLHKYAGFSPASSGGWLPDADSADGVMGRAFLESVERQDFSRNATITVAIELNESDIRYQADLQVRGQIVRQGPSNVIKIPARQAKLTRALEKILSEISQFIRDCKDPILDLVS